MYRLILSAKELPYKDFDLDAEAIAKGNIPSGEDFETKVLKAYAVARKKKDFDQRSFNATVMELYRDLRSVLKSGKPKEGIQEQLTKAQEELAVLEKLLEGKRNLLKTLSSDSDYGEAVKVMEEALAKKNVKLEFKAASVNYDTIVEAGAGDVKEHALEQHNMFLVKVTPMMQLKRDLDTLKKGIKDPKAIAAVRHELGKQITDANEAINVVKQTIVKLTNKLRQVGQKPKMEMVRQPITIDPLGDIGDIKVLFETMKHPVEEKAVQKTHPYNWLYQPVFMTTLLRKLTEKSEEKSIPHHKEDIGEDVMPNINKAMLQLKRLAEKLQRFFVGQYSLFTEMDIKEQALSVIPEDTYNKYAAYLNNLKSTLSEKDFKDLTTYDIGDKAFAKPYGELSPALKADRDKLEKFFNIMHDMAAKNKVRFESKWGDIADRCKKLKLSYQEFKKLYNVISKEEYYKTWLKGGTPAFIKKAYDIVGSVTAADGALAFKDPELGFQSVMAAMGDLRDHVKENALLTAKDLPEFEKAFKEAEDMDKWINDLGKYITQIDSAIEKYYTETEEFINKIISGNILKAPKAKKAAWDAMSLVYNIRRAARKMLAALPKGAPGLFQEHVKEKGKEHGTMQPIKDTKYEAKPHPATPADKEAPEEWRSEYPISNPLQKKKPTKEPPLMSKTYLNYFIKSFPVEEVLNEWFVNLGGKKTLDPAKLPELKKSIEAHIRKDMEGKVDKDKLQKERDSKEDRLDKVMEEIKGLDKKTKSLGTWANDSFDEYDTAIENAKLSGEVYDKEIKGMVDRLKANNKEREELQKEFEALPAKHVTPEIVKKMSGRVVHLHGEYNKIMEEIRTNLRTLLEEKKIGENPFTRSRETIDSLINKASRVWNVYNNNMVRNINRIEDLQDEEYKIENRIAEIDDWLENKESVSEDFINDGVKNFLAYLWHSIDEHWMRSIKEFQSRFNLNFIDYIAIRDAFEKLIQHPVSGRAIERIVKELKQNIKFLRDKNQEIPAGYTEALAKLTKRSVKDVKEYEEKAPEGETAKKAMNLGLPTPLTYKIAAIFAGIDEPGEAAILS